MKIRRFVAKDMRSALAQIKEELGADAVIMSNKKIPEGVELMAAVDYSQSVPDANYAAEKSPSTELSQDVVNIGQQNVEAPAQAFNEASAAPIKAFGQHILNTQLLSEQDLGSEPSIGAEKRSVSTNNAPADSLSALLNRQVQSSAPIQTNQASVEAIKTQNNQALNEEETIEQQLRSFTERLQYSTPEGVIPAPSDVVASSKAMSAANSVPEQFASLEEEQMVSQLTNQNNQQEHSNVNQDDFDKMQQEMASIRQLLEHQVSGLMWQDMAQKDPQRAVLVNRLLALGLNEQIADQIAGYVPAQNNKNQAWQQAKHLIAQQINTTQNDIIHRGGVVSLVGPTGVGKTTTIAKLAARFAQTHGSDQVALISTDTFRIAGFDQLMTYGKIIGCSVELAKDSQTLDVLLQKFAKKKLILIDTAGMGQRDIRLAENLTTLVSNSRVRIRNYLVLAANCQQQVMQENVERFKKVPLSGCIYTKLDESVSIGEIITTSIQNGLPIGYLTDGQRVPEDIKVANAEKLVTLADKMATKLSTKNTVSLRTMPVTPAMA
ncbi:MAG: flagellar biosynthesis protein FlhF [Colwellia sp.]